MHTSVIYTKRHHPEKCPSHSRLQVWLVASARVPKMAVSLIPLAAGITGVCYYRLEAGAQRLDKMGDARSPTVSFSLLP